MKEAKKRGRKPKYSTEAEREEAKKLYRKEYYQKNKKADKSKPSGKQKTPEPKKALKPKKAPEPQADKAFCLRLEKAEKDIEAIKWELFGRKI